MNCALGSYNNGKRIFLATGQNENCYVYQIKLSTGTPSSKNGNTGMLNHSFSPSEIKERL